MILVFQKIRVDVRELSISPQHSQFPYHLDVLVQMPTALCLNTFSSRGSVLGLEESYPKSQGVTCPLINDGQELVDICPILSPPGGIIVRCALHILLKVLCRTMLQPLTVTTFLGNAPRVACCPFALTPPFFYQCSPESHPYTKILNSGSTSTESQHKTNLLYL